jgi:hypothetical protein
MGEQTANNGNMPGMDREPKAERDTLTQAEIAQLRQNLARLSADGVERFYREAHASCAVERKPSPKVIQQLVAAWKTLRKWNWH